MKLPELIRNYRRLRVQLEALYAQRVGNSNRINDITEQLLQVERALAAHGRLMAALTDDFEAESEKSTGEAA